MTEIIFGPFTIKGDPAHLWCGDEAIPLRPKSLEVLRYLAERPGHLVSKEKLLNRVWTGRIISDSGVRLCIREIRNALGDDAKTPQYVETVAGSGYRFLEGRDGRVVFSEREKIIVGRDSELSQLEEYFHQAVDEGSKLILVSGEPGIGKTTLLECFLDRILENNAVRILKSQCIVHFGPGEAYGPVLEAIVLACQGEDNKNLSKILGRLAPGWLNQMPGVADSFDLERIQDQITGMSPERMIREFCHFAEAVAQEKTLILVIEDLHWADDATVDLLAALAENPNPSLLIIGTYRPTDAVLYSTSLRQTIKELKGRDHCTEMSLEFISESDVADYLSARLSGRISEKLVTQIFERSSGNPLFMVSLIEQLIGKQVLENTQGSWAISSQTEDLEHWIPESLQALISRRIDELSEEQIQMLEVASAVGLDFTSGAITEALDQAEQESDRQLEYLAFNGLFIEENGIAQWPDGTISGRYRFQHPMYLEVIYNSIGEARKIQIHRRIGEALESRYLDQSNTIAPILATHFDHGLVSDRAIRYYQDAVEQSLERHAYSVAIGHLSNALHSLESIPQSMERDQKELNFLIQLGPAQIALEGYTSASVEKTYHRARNLCNQLKESELLVPILWNLAGFHMARSELSESRALIEQLDKQAERASDPIIDLVINDAYAQQLFFEGNISESLERCEIVASQYDVAQHCHLANTYSQEDPGIACNSIAALVLWMLGYPDRSVDRMQVVDKLFTELNNPHSTAFGLFFVCTIQQFRGDVLATEKLAEELCTLCELHEIQSFLPSGKVFKGWAKSQRSPEAEHLELVTIAIQTHRESGARLLLPYLLGLLAQTCWAHGNINEAQEAIAEALTLTEKYNERWSEAELHRLQGELRENKSEQQNLEAVKCFERSIAVAREQQANFLELRAALSLSQLWMRQGRSDDAHQLLQPIIVGFPEGTETEDLINARSLVKGD